MPLRVRTFQTSCEPLSRDLAIRTIASRLKACDVAGVDMAYFPEGYLTGYASDEPTIARYAVALDSSFFLSLLEACSGIGTTVVLGFLEKFSTSYANTAAVIRRGELLGLYRKNHTNEKTFIPGTCLPAFELPQVCFGVNICYDANFSAPALTLARRGTQVIFYPLNNLMRRETADVWRHKSAENLRERARETGCWVISADVTGICHTRISYGCTHIVAPDGSLTAAVSEGEVGFVTADLELPICIVSQSS